MNKFEELINKYNIHLAFEDRGYRVTYDTKYHTGILILAKTNGIDDYTFYLTEECHDELIQFFKCGGVKISFNNFGNIFWQSDI